MVVGGWGGRGNEVIAPSRVKQRSQGRSQWPGSHPVQ